MPLGRKIVIFGPSGSGKSTLGRQLGAPLGLPVLELDAVFHAHPNWVDLTPDEFRAQVSGFLARHPGGWVIDGNYSDVRGIVLPLADSAIWLKLPFRTVYRRLAWRTVSRSFAGAELWNGNRESLRQTFLSKESMLVWGIHAWRRHHVKVALALRAGGHQARPYLLRTPGQVRYLVDQATPEPPGSATMPGHMQREAELGNRA